MVSSSHDQIEQYGQRIAEARVKLGMPAEAPAPMAPCPGGQCSVAPSAMSTHTHPACHPGASDTCSSTCTLADSICDNASRICALAKELPGDTWASDRCASATTSCHDAHGSNNERMLVAKEPMLCQRCHVSSRHPATIYDQTQVNTRSNRVMGRSCTQCHTQIHGSNHPSGNFFLR